jgi:hypothetical protein
MFAEPNVFFDEAWNLLQEPARPTAEPRYQLLMAALDTGWQVEEPVYLRPRWTGDGPRVYHFILRRPAQPTPRLLTVPASVAIDQFVCDEGLRVLS